MAPPGTSNGSVASSRRPMAAPSLSCNLCHKPLATTCFLCACDCVFCEECTYSHFEQSSQCPTCNRRLGEQDFTELVVADSNGKDVCKATMQSLFSKQSGSGALHYANVCQSLIQQSDSLKKNTKFLLKQLLVESHRASRMSMQASRGHEQLKAENTQLKQMMASQRLQYEQTLTDMQNAIKAKDSKISEQNHMLNNFRKLQGGGGGNGRGGGSTSRGQPPHMVPHSSLASLASSRGSEPPLRGLMAQREATQKAQQNVMNGGTKRSFMSNMNNMNRTKSPGANFRPFSSGTSAGSNSVGGSIASNRIRDLTANSGYHFTGIPGQSQGGMNKRRRGGGNSVGSGGTGPSPHHAMSPNTAFALNQGSHSRDLYRRS